MKAILLPIVAGLGLAVCSAAQPAKAAGCLKGAVVGGVAGHFLHHGLLGAAAGCAVGHHQARKRAEAERARHAGGAGSSDYREHGGPGWDRR